MTVNAHKITISGNLVADAESRFTGEGKAMINMRVAVNRREQNADKEWVDVTYWYRITTIPRTEGQTKYIQDNAVKGNRVFAIGDLKASTYQSRDGETRMSFDIAFPDVLEFFAKSSQNGNGNHVEDETPKRQPATSGSKSSGRSSSRATAPADDDTSLEDLPF